MPVDVPDNSIHRLCVRCRKWHWPAEGRDHTLPRAGRALTELGRLTSGITDAPRFICHGCVHAKARLRIWIFGALGVLILAALILRAVLVP